MRFNGQKGMALISVIMLTLILISLGAAVLYLTFSDSMIINDEVSFYKALYAAEGGIRKFIVELNYNPDVEDWSQKVWDGFKNYKVGDGEIENINVKDMGDFYEVTVIGKCGQAKKTLVVKISKPRRYSLIMVLRGLTVWESDFYLADNTNIEGDIFVNGNVMLAGNAAVKGNIYSSQNFSSADDSLVDGNIYAAERISTSESSEVLGKMADGANIEKFVPPVIDFDWYMKESQNMGQYFDGNKQFSKEELVNMSGIYYVEGNVTFESDVKNYMGQALIVSKGSIHLNDGQQLVPADRTSSLSLISSSEIFFDGTSVFSGVVISQGVLRVFGSGFIEGAAAAAEIESFTKDFLYNSSFVEKLSDCIRAEEAAVLEWKELYPVY
ncbi:MAG: hypothetical protein XD50_0676 [Clostridia bacterium 41_269]|nr:MAG: hypothetical protein XD50_0676 [Clostridia bacterium 41_269]